MINIDAIFEFRKGILFIRLLGSITKETVNKYLENVTLFICNNHIKNITLNFNRVEKIDDIGISLINQTYEIVSSYNGTIYVTGLNSISNRLSKNINLINNELEAFNNV